MSKDGGIITNKDEASLGDVVKVGAGVGVSTVVFRLSEVAVNKIKNKSESSNSSGDVFREYVGRDRKN